MKHYILHILAMSMLIMSTSCVKEMSGVSPSGDEGEITLSLDVSTGKMPDVIVKNSWADNDAAERAVYNLRIYVFSESGHLAGYGLFGKLTTSEVSDGYNAKVEHVHTSTGEKLYIYGIANATNSQYWVSDNNILDIDDAATSTLTREQFLQATYTRQKESYNPRDNQFLMTGYVNDGKPVTIARKEGSVNAEITGLTDDAKRLKLYKVMSKNSIEIKTGEGTGITFDPDYMEIYNMPSSAALMRRLPIETDEALRPAAGDFETFERIVLDENTLTWYMPENLQNSDKVVSTFNDREKNTYVGDVKIFDNAPENATYIVIHGRYESAQYKGNVEYTIHLGDFGKSMSDFNVVRNYNYKYTITINGVDNFIAESECQTGKYDHGSEGIIINTSSGQLLNVDCHYEARVMQFKKSELKALIDQNFGYIIKIKTAFGETTSLLAVPEHTKNGITIPAGIYDAADFKDKLDNNRKPQLLSTINTDGSVSDPGALVLSGELDFDWVHFVRNTGTRETYTGTSSSTGGQTHGINEVCAYPGDENSNVMNVFQFFQKLYDETLKTSSSFFNQDSGNSVYVTCFIDENYYEHKNWSEYVNKNEDRVLYCANSFSTSEDRRSSYAKAKYVVSQKSIKSFYSADVALPFGIESISEEDVVWAKDNNFRLLGGNNKAPKNWEGRASALTNNTSTADNRDKYAYSVFRNIGTQDMYKDPYKACMSRNRDANGDGTIQGNEIKWYLAAVDQYKGVWVVDDFLPTEVKLFEPSADNWRKLNGVWNNNDHNLEPWHYFTASSQSIFWAEEGCSTGNSGNAVMVRCIRTLQNNGKGLEESDKYYSSQKTGSGTTAETVISLDLAPGATRSFQGSAQQPSYERGQKHNNKVYNKFKVASSNIGPYTRGEILNSSNGADFIAADKDVCQTQMGMGWRVPTQKELSLMSAVLSTTEMNLTNNKFLWCSTSFTGLDTGYYKHDQGDACGGFALISNGSMTIAPSGSGYVRCVMDVKE